MAPPAAPGPAVQRRINERSLTVVLQRNSTYQDDFDRFGFSEEEVEEAKGLFKQRLAQVWKLASVPKQRREKLSIEDVDLVMRQLRVFVTTRFIWALFLEIDENKDRTVDQEEFLMMVAKLRGRRPLSPKFYLGILSRKATEQFTAVFRILDSDNDGLLDEEGMFMGLRQLNPHVNVDMEEFRGILGKLAIEDKNLFPLEDFLVLQAKFQQQPPALEAALLSLTPKEREKYERAFAEWREARGSAPGPQELQKLLNQMGHETSPEVVSSKLGELELRGQQLEVQHFLYIVVSLGAGTCERLRPVIKPGATYEEAFLAGMKVEELWDLGYDDLPRLKQAGYSAQALHRARMADVKQLRKLGYAAIDLRKSGVAASEMRQAGYALDELRNAGFSAEVLRTLRAAAASTAAPTSAPQKAK